MAALFQQTPAANASHAASRITLARAALQRAANHVSFIDGKPSRREELNDARNRMDWHAMRLAACLADIARIHAKIDAKYGRSAAA
jgi:hypothetical protein